MAVTTNVCCVSFRQNILNIVKFILYHFECQHILCNLVRYTYVYKTQNMTSYDHQLYRKVNKSKVGLHKFNENESHILIVKQTGVTAQGSPYGKVCARSAFFSKCCQFSALSNFLVIPGLKHELSAFHLRHNI